jgi:hypothetical protein
MLICFTLLASALSIARPVQAGALTLVEHTMFFFQEIVVTVGLNVMGPTLTL